MKEKKVKHYYVHCIGYTTHCFSYKDARELYMRRKEYESDVCLTNDDNKVIFSKGTYFDYLK